MIPLIMCYVPLSLSVELLGPTTPSFQTRIHYPQISNEIDMRGLASAMSSKLSRMWKTNSITARTKIKLCRPFVTPVLMYGSGCWCLGKENERKILVAEVSWLRRIVGKTRRDSIRNKVIQIVLGQTETLVSRISKRKLTWCWCVVRMEDKRLPAKLLQFYMDGKRSRGRQRHGWKTSGKTLQKIQGLENGHGYYKRQMEVEPSCKTYEPLTEEGKEEKMPRTTK